MSACARARACARRRAHRRGGALHDGARHVAAGALAQSHDFVKSDPQAARAPQRDLAQREVRAPHVSRCFALLNELCLTSRLFCLHFPSPPSFLLCLAELRQTSHFPISLFTALSFLFSPLFRFSASSVLHSSPFSTF
eukprot:784046-Pleurochrysis_carterae.AAC.1